MTTELGKVISHHPPTLSPANQVSRCLGRFGVANWTVDGESRLDFDIRLRVVPSTRGIRGRKSNVKSSAFNIPDRQVFIQTPVVPRLSMQIHFSPDANCMTATQASILIIPGKTLASPDDTSNYQLLNLGPNTWILHVLLQSRRVALGLLQDGLHDWVLQDTHDLNVIC